MINHSWCCGNVQKLTRPRIPHNQMQTVLPPKKMLFLSHQPLLWLHLLYSSGVRHRRPSSCCRTYCWQTPFTLHYTHLVPIPTVYIYTPSAICIYRSLQMLLVFLRNFSYFLSTLYFALWVRPGPFCL